MKSSAVAYCWEVCGPTRSFLLLHLGAVVYGAYVEWNDPGASLSALIFILFIQMFSAATGFAGPASRGYLDSLLVSGRPRLNIGASHFLASSAPGLAAWLLIGFFQVIRLRTASVAPFQPAGMAGILLISSVAWSLTLPAPRFSGGLLWLAVAIVTAVVWQPYGFVLMSRLSRQEINENLGGFVANALAFPMFIPFVNWPIRALLFFSVLASLAFGLGIAYVTFREYPLAEED